jgi:hypothetical protein
MRAFAASGAIQPGAALRHGSRLVGSICYATWVTSSGAKFGQILQKDAVRTLRPALSGTILKQCA